MKKILILSANPLDTNKLRLDEEVREIQAALRQARNREQFEIVTEWAVRTDDLRRALLYHEPTLVHFCGHGLGSTGLALENNFGQVQLVRGESLARLFKLFRSKVECVLLNACYSQEQADAIYQYIDCVIGMNRAIGDVAAIKFAVAFYDTLGAGYSYEDCFEVGCASIDLEGIPESETPVLKLRERSPERRLPLEASPKGGFIALALRIEAPPTADSGVPQAVQEPENAIKSQPQALASPNVTQGAQEGDNLPSQPSSHQSFTNNIEKVVNLNQGTGDINIQSQILNF
ncbi:CHAT domain-containing protein [Scytonema sp. NUACC26]|uniref:CHAT domain-containing protein n=1 Tax=Scytonema sp. NUACC26 TaxID=3140176 RepID=UPI0034DCB805